MLKELCNILEVLAKEPSCHVALLSSAGSSFCEGVDYRELVSNNKDTRKIIAETYATSIT